MRHVAVALFAIAACGSVPKRTAVALPEGKPGIGFDDLRYSPSLGRVLVPAGRTGRLDLIDPRSLAVTSVSGFASKRTYGGGHDDGPTSVEEARGLLYVTDRTAQSLVTVDVKRAAVIGRTPLAAGPDYVRFAAATNELWVTEPGADQLEIFALAGDGTPHATATLHVANGPESLVFDARRGRAYTHRWERTTVVLDVTRRAVVAEWPNGCQASRGIALDEARGFLFAACSEGTVSVLDVEHDGRLLSKSSNGSGFDVMGYSAALGHLYLAGGRCSCFVVLGVDATGTLKLLGREPAPPSTHCAVADDQGHAWVCNPAAGELWRFNDAFAKSPIAHANCGLVASALKAFLMVGRFRADGGAVIAACAALGCGGKSVAPAPPAGSDAGRPARGGGSATDGSSGDTSSGDTSNGASSNGGSSSATDGNSTCSPGGNTVLIPSETGWVDSQDTCNDVGVQGPWYAFGDAYGDGPNGAPCITVGGHLPEECAVIETPAPPPTPGFPNVGGFMHTEGTAEVILPCVDGSDALRLALAGCPATDFTNMSGAGIGFDLNADSGDRGGERHTWDPEKSGVVGLRFTLEGMPANGMRVEFPMLLTDAEAAAVEPVALPSGAATDEHPGGSPYWGAQAKGNGKFPSSPIKEGDNTIYWSDVQPPRVGDYTFDTKRLLGVHFHVPTNLQGAAPFAFTIWNVTFLRQ